jgi:hypothetical protein
LPCQAMPLIGWACHVSISALVIDVRYRTAVYVTRMYGGVGGEEP